MKLKLFLQKINPRLIAVHGIAMWMFIYAFDLFARLYYLPVTKVLMYSKTTSEALGKLEKQGFTAMSLGEYVVFFFFVPIAGLLLAFIISLVIGLFKKWFWLNSFLAFVIMFVLYREDITGWRYLQFIFLIPGRLLKHNLIFFLVTNASTLLSLGLLLFFLKPLNNFIQFAGFKKKPIAV